MFSLFQVRPHGSHRFAVCCLQYPSPAPLAGTVADFSSYGPAIDLSFKPDIAAPGAIIVRRMLPVSLPLPGLCLRHAQRSAA